MSGVAPPTVDALRRVRRRTSGTHQWTFDAGRAGTRIRSEALHRMLTIGRPAADRAGARPYHRIGIASSNGRTWCTVSHIMVMSPQVSWLFFKARAKRPYLDSYGSSEQRRKTANRPRPGGLR